MKSKGDLHLVEYRNPDNGRRHKVWLFRKQSPPPDTSAVHCGLKTLTEDGAVVVRFQDRNGEDHWHKYPMENIARVESAPEE